MTDPSQPIENIASTDRDPEELLRIFDNIEDYLSFWNVLYNDDAISQNEDFPVTLSTLQKDMDWLIMSIAPLYPSKDARGLRWFVYRFLNLVVKIFGSPQIHFNRKFHEFLGDLFVSLQEFNHRTVALSSTVDLLNNRIRLLEEESDHYRQEIETLTGLLKELGKEPDPSRNERGGDGA